MQRLADAGHSDDELMALCASGDAVEAAGAFRCLFDRHGQNAWRLAWRLTGDAGEAEDLVQEGFARLWKQAGMWAAGQAGAGAFLQRVITNLAIDRSRRKRPEPVAEVPDSADPAPLADALLETANLSARIQACVASLPDRQRAAIVLTYWEGLTGPMAAEVMDLSPKAFESLLIRARAALKSVLAAAGINTSLLPGDTP